MTVYKKDLNTLTLMKYKGIRYYLSKMDYAVTLFGLLTKNVLAIHAYSLNETRCFDYSLTLNSPVLYSIKENKDFILFENQRSKFKWGKKDIKNLKLQLKTFLQIN